MLRRKSVADAPGLLGLASIELTRAQVRALIAGRPGRELKAQVAAVPPGRRGGALQGRVSIVASVAAALVVAALLA